MSPVYQRQQRQQTRPPGPHPGQVRRVKVVRTRIIEQLEFFWAQHDRGPTRVELAKAVGISDETLRVHLNALRDAGVVTWNTGERHSLRMSGM